MKKILLISFCFILSKSFAQLSTQTPTRLDSIIETEYDELGNVTDLYRELFYYDENNNDTLLLSWYLEDGEWFPSGKNTFSYDDDGNMIQLTRFRYNEDSDEHDFYERTNLTYDENGFEKSQIDLSWDEDDMEFVVYSNEQYINDLNGNVIEVISVDNKEVNSYDNHNLITKNTGYDWDYNIEDFVISDSTIYTYDSSNRLILEERYNTYSGVAELSTSKTAEFTQEGDLVIELVKEFQNNGSELVFDYQYVDTLDLTGNVLADVGFGINSVSNMLESSSYESNQFDTRILYSDVVYPYFYEDDADEGYINKLDIQSYYELNEDETAFYLEEQLIFYYSESPTGVNDDIYKNDLQIYPNPTSGIINTAIGTIQIFDSIGNLVFTQQSTGKIDVSNLNSGIYIIALDDKKTKLIIE